MGERRSVSTSASSEDALTGDEKSLEVRPVESLGTCKVCRCTSRGAVSCKDDVEAPTAFGFVLGVLVEADIPLLARSVTGLTAFVLAECAEASVELKYAGLGV